MYTVSQKKHATLHSFINLTNKTDFQNSFTVTISQKFATKLDNISHHTLDVFSSTLQNLSSSGARELEAPQIQM